VHDYADLLRASIASAGNDQPFGSKWSTTCYISIFIGKFLTEVLQQVETRVGDKFDEQDEAILKLDIHKSIPDWCLIIRTGTGHLRLHLQ